MPIAFESFNFDEFDLVISVTSEAAKGIVTKPHTKHISIILTPTRYLWSGYENYFSNPIFRIISWPIVSYLRFWDKIAAKRPDKLIAISQTVRSRIKKYYGLDSEVIYPPLMIREARNFPHVASDAQLPRVERSKSLSQPSLSERKHIKYESNSKDSSELALNSLASGKVPHFNYFLVVSRLVPYKKIDLAVRAANKVHVPLKIIGTGSELGRLKKMAGPTVEFLGYVSDSDLKYYYSNCKALVFPGVEDFGLTMVEAQAFGKPVIAFRGGGAEEIVTEGKTGVFFDRQTVASLSEKLKSFRPSRYNSLDCRINANKFSFDRFKTNILGVL
ncbi:MAG: glycosyltransferase [Candidatus Levybacteria bacterium]|nr:glycosyltransferase [Candidatus Levybacteria bacterium]